MARMSSSEWLAQSTLSPAENHDYRRMQDCQNCQADDALSPEFVFESEATSSDGTSSSDAETVLLFGGILDACVNERDPPTTICQPPRPQPITSVPRNHPAGECNNRTIALDVTSSVWSFNVSHIQWNQAWRRNRIHETPDPRVFRMTPGNDLERTIFLQCYDTCVNTGGPRINVMPWLAHCHGCVGLQRLDHYDALHGGLIGALAMWIFMDDTYHPNKLIKWLCRACVAKMMAPPPLTIHWGS